MFRVESDWLYSLNVVFCCDMNAKVFVLSKLFSAKPESTVFFFTNQDLLQQRVHGFRALRGIATQQVVHDRRHHSNES